MINEDMCTSLLRMSILSATDLYCKSMLNYLLCGATGEKCPSSEDKLIQM